MSWRTVVITGNAKLDYKMDYMVVRKADATTRIYLGEMGLLLIESTAVSLTTMLLCELTKHKVKVVFCDEKHNPQTELAAYYGSHDTSVKVRNQIGWSHSASWWTGSPWICSRRNLKKKKRWNLFICWKMRL